MRRAIDAQFPALAAAGYEIIGEPTDEYNCIAYAAGETHRWWSNEDSVQLYWPEPAGRTPLIASLIAVFTNLGYEPADDDSVEAGYVKVALFRTMGNGRTPPGKCPTDIGAASSAPAL